MAVERRDSSGALIFVPTESDLRTIESMQNINKKSNELDRKLGEVDELTKKLEGLISQYEK